MRLFKFKKCKRIHQLDFTPDCRQLMIVGGARASQVDRAIWLNLASGDVAANLPLFEDAPLGQAYGVASNQSRLVIGQTIYQPDQLPELFKFCQPLRSPDVWQPCPMPFDWAPSTFSYNVVDLALAPDGSRLAAIVEHQFNFDDSRGPDVIHLLLNCRLTPDGTVGEFSSRHCEPCYGLTFTPGGASWAIASHAWSGHFELSLFRGLSEPPATVQLVGRRLRGLRFSPDGRMAAAIVLRSVIVLDADTLRTQGVLAAGGRMVHDVAFASNSRTLFLASSEGSVRAWDLVSSHLVRTFEWEIGPLTAVACSPDGTLCAAGGKDGQVVLWDWEP